MAARRAFSRRSQKVPITSEGAGGAKITLTTSLSTLGVPASRRDPA